MTGPIRVIVVDDHEAVREGLRWMLKADDTIDVVGEARDGNALLELIRTTPCDAVLLDLAMPGMDGLEVLAALRSSSSPVPVVVLTMHDDASHVDRALARGASGYVLKSASRQEIIRALEAATTGGAYVQPSLAKPLLARHISGESVETVESPVALSGRQLQLLRALAAGGANKELAHEMGISEATVKSYLKELYARLGVASRAGAVGYGLRHGLIK